MKQRVIAAVCLVIGAAVILIGSAWASASASGVHQGPHAAASVSGSVPPSGPSVPPTSSSAAPSSSSRTTSSVPSSSTPNSSGAAPSSLSRTTERPSSSTAPTQVARTGPSARVTTSLAIGAGLLLLGGLTLVVARRPRGDRLH